MDWNQVALIGVKLLAVLALVLLNAFFVATEFALVKVRMTQLEPLSSRGHKRAGMALHLTHHLDAYLSACQLGITLASLGLGWIGEPVFVTLLQPVFALFGVESEHLRESIAVAVGFSTITFLHIVVGEMAPKSLGIRLALPTSLWVAYPMRWFYVAMYPFIHLLNESALLLLRWLGLQPAQETEAASSEEELQLLVAASQKQFGASRFSRDLVQNALELRHRLARDVMRPRRELVAFDTSASIAECLELAEKTRYSRFPLCEDGELDRAVGVVHIKDVYPLRLQGGTGQDLRRVARKLMYAPETARLEKLLQTLLERRLHVMLVVDEYGGVTGMVTLENILEEIVGQIQDEFDAEKPLCRRLSDSDWLLQGELPVHDLEDLVGEPLQEEGVVTVSGLVTQRLGGFPKLGDTLRLGAFDLRVETVDHLRVGEVRLSRRTPAAGSEAGGTAGDR